MKFLVLQIRRKLQISSHLLENSLTENFFFCTVSILDALQASEYASMYHYVISIRIRSFSGPHFSAIKLITEITP